MSTRRRFLSGIAAAAAVRGNSHALQRPAILLRSSWQTVNIGDIAHTPGMLAILEKHIPEAGQILWPAKPLDRGVEPMLLRRFPRLRIVQEKLGPHGEPSAALRDAFAAADLLIHGSAAGIGSTPEMNAWRHATNKAYGFFGVGYSPAPEGGATAVPASLRDLLESARFIFTRETASLANLRKAQIHGPALDFAPDATFSMDILDEARGKAFLRENTLTPGNFLCVIPRLRYTPYQKFSKVNWSEEETRRRMTVNDRFAEPDHAKLREVIVAWVKQTGGKVLLCPEVTYQLDIIGPLLYDPLPEDVKRHCVRRTTYWLPDEAGSVYRRAAAVVSFENHSPILAAVQGTPCIYVHQPEDGIKVHMWADIGLGDWCFEVEQSRGSEIAARVLEIHRDPQSAREKVRKAVEYAQTVQAQRASFVRNTVG